MHKFKILPLLILIAAFLVAGCAEEETRNSPSADITTFCNAILKSDDASLQKIGMTKAEYQKELADEFVRSFNEAAEINFSEQQIQPVMDAFFKVLNKTNFSVKDVSQEGDKATVAVTIDVLDKISEDDIIEFLSPELVLNGEDAVKDAVIKSLAYAVEGLPVAGSETFNVECVYHEKEKMWMPKDGKEFGVQLTEKLLGENK